MAYIDTKYLGKCETRRHHRSGQCDTWCDCGECYQPDMTKIPTADVVEVKRGYWIKNQYISQVLGIPVKKEFVFICSLCGHNTIGKSKYCRECGAKMDGTPKERGD